MKPKNYKYSICCFFATYPALRSKSNVWLDRNHDTSSMTKWINMSTRGLLLKWASTIKFNYTWWSRYKAVHVLVKVQSGTRVGQGTKRYMCWSRYKADIIISSICNLLTLRWTTLTTSLLYKMISFLIYISNNWQNHYNYSFKIFAINGVLQCFSSK
jgi:hypothetical protein